MILLYDNTFDGLLTVIFEVYRLKINDFQIIAVNNYNEQLFVHFLNIHTNKAKSNRIKLGLIKKTTVDHLPYLHYLYFKKKDNKEKLIYQFIKAVFEVKKEKLTLDSSI